MRKYLYANQPAGISREELADAIQQTTNSFGPDVRRVLLIAPDNTRAWGLANVITNLFYENLKDRCTVDILIALGTHLVLSEAELRQFFGNSIPLERFIQHDWRNDVEQIGVVPAEVISEISGGEWNEAIEVEINKHMIHGNYDQIVSIGQIVPHEMLGMSNYTKNIFVGIGGYNLISKSHIIGPLCDVQYHVGEIDNPVRHIFDYAHEHFLKDYPLLFVMTVTTLDAQDQICLDGLFIGPDREAFEKGSALSCQKNITYLDAPVKKVVACLDEVEFRSAWLGDKAIQRTHTIIADGGELIILAPGVKQFGDDAITDTIMRKYGYDRRAILRQKLFDPDNTELRENLAAAGQLLLTTTDGRYKVTYAVQHLSKEEVETVGFGYMPLADAWNRYDPSQYPEGYNTLPDGEEFYLIHRPEVGFWTCKP